MKEKQIKQLAIQIAEQEKIIQTSKDKNLINKAQDKIIQLSAKISSFEEMIMLDEFITEMLEKK